MNMRIATAARGLPQITRNAAVVGAIKPVTELMGEIRAASNRQSQGRSPIATQSAKSGGNHWDSS